MRSQPPSSPAPPLGPGGLLLVLLAFASLAVMATWPLARQARNHVFGLGTPPLNVWAMGAVLHKLRVDPLTLFDGNAFYPYGNSLAFSEHLFVPALLAAPVVGFSGNLVLAHNVVALASMALAGLGMFLLARELTGHQAGAFVAGILYAFHTWNVNELARLQILSNQWFPFLVLALIRYLRQPSWAAAAWVAAVYLLQSLSCMYWALYAPLLLAGLTLFLSWRRGSRPKDLLPLAMTLGAAALILIPFVRPYLENARRFGFSRTLPESVPVDRYFDVLPGNWLYAGLLGTASPNRDAAHFLGLTALALAAVGLWRGRFREDTRAWKAFLAALTLASILLGLGPEMQVGELSLGPGPYRILWDWLPGFRNVRYPERFSLFAVLGLAPLVAAGVASLRVRPLLAGPLAGAALFLEHLSTPLALAPLPTRVAEAQVWLAGQPDARVVAEVPGTAYRLDRLEAESMYLSTWHWKRTVQGFTGYYPPTQSFLRWRLHHFPDPESLAFLEGFGVDTLIINPGVETPTPPREIPKSPALVAFPGGQRVLRLSPTYRLLGPPPLLPAALVELDRSRWQLLASSPRAEWAIDGDPETAWTTGLDQPQGSFFRIRFAESQPVARVSMLTTALGHFPMRFKLRGRTSSLDSDWVDLPFDLTQSYDDFFRALLHRPRAATLDLDLDGRSLAALQVKITEDDSFQMPWSMAELRVYRAAGSSSMGQGR